MAEPSPEAPAVVRRLRVFLIIAVVAALVAGAGLVASLWVKSPGQRAAEQAPPSASVVTTEVQERVLEKTTVIRGTVGASAQITVTGAGGAAGARRVVTGLRVEPGAAVTSGTVLGSVSGRPLIVLHGDSPAFRDLRPGMAGVDVSQLQVALVELGHLPEAAKTGTYDRPTEAAVRALYTSRSWQPLTTSDQDPTETSRIGEATSGVRTAQRAVEDARTALKAIPVGAPSTAAQRTLSRAQEDLAAAQQQLSLLQTASGIVVPLSEVVFSPMPALVDTITAKVGTDLGAATDPTVLTLAAGTLTVTGTIPSGSQQGVSVGAAATITDESNGTTKTGTVSAIGAYQGPKDSITTAGYPVSLAIPETLTPGWVGRNVQVRIVVSATSGKVLVAPLTAIRSADDGSSYVVVVTASGSARLAVRTGLVAGGEVEITTVEPNAIGPGTKVQVG